MQIDYQAQIWKEGEQFVAHAMPLDIASAGGSAEEARNALEEAVGLFLRTAAEHGTLEDVLQDAGYQRHAEGWRSPDWISVERHHAVVAA